jgi:hypothetical protein
MVTPRAITPAIIVAFTAVACTPDAPADDAGEEATGEAGAAMADEAQDGWIPLFDGTDLSAWRGYQRDDMPAGWQIRDGTLVLDPSGDGGDIVTRAEFADFELELEWRVEPGGNSGIFFRADEEADAIWYHAPEMQILDDDAHADGADPTTSAGACYALYAPTEDVVRPAGEWNHVRIVARGPRVEHWMNGTRILTYQIGSEDWDRRVEESKFSAYPGFGEATEGRIGLQDHGDVVAFRGVRIRPLDGDTP